MAAAAHKRVWFLIFCVAGVTAFGLTGCSHIKPAPYNIETTHSSQCPVHRVGMKEAPVVYGYPTEDMIRQAEQGRLILGGCEVGKMKTGYICPVDKKAYYLKK